MAAKKNPRKRTSVPKLPPAGTYTGKIVSLALGVHPGQLSLTFDIEKATVKQAEPATYGDVTRYLVVYRPLLIYTTIAARNIHHAINKATRDCGGRYTSINEGHSTEKVDFLHVMGYRFRSLAIYNKLTSEVRY